MSTPAAYVIQHVRNDILKKETNKQNLANVQTKPCPLGPLKSNWATHTGFTREWGGGATEGDNSNLGAVRRLRERVDLGGVRRRDECGQNTSYDVLKN